MRTVKRDAFDVRGLIVSVVSSARDLRQKFTDAVIGERGRRSFSRRPRTGMIGSRIRLRRSLRINNGLKVINGVLDVRINFTMQQSPTFEARASWCRDRDPLDYRLINVPRTLRTSLAQLRPNRHTRYRTLVPILTPRTHWTQVSTDRRRWPNDAADSIGEIIQRLVKS